MLLSNGAVTNFYSVNNETALSIAVRERFTDIVRILLIHGADVNQIVEYGCTILHLACHREHLQIFELFVNFSRNINVNVTENRYGKTSCSNR